MPGISNLASDMLAAAAGKVFCTNTRLNSSLVLGGFRCGKSAVLRDMACQLSTKFGKHVAYLDTWDEIADTSAANRCIGKAKHIRVLDNSNQAYEVC